MNNRLFLRKKSALQTESSVVLSDIKKTLHLPDIKTLTIYDSFDIFDVPEAYLDELIWQVLGDPTTDEQVVENDIHADLLFALEYLPGQFVV